MKIKLSIIAILFIFSRLCFGGASDWGDIGVYALPSAPTLPAAGGTFIDPTFGTIIIRVTDENDDPTNIHNYAQYSPFNSNSTRFIVSATSGNNASANLYSLNPTTLAISNLGSLFATPMLSWADVCWSGTDPEVMYSFEANSQKLYKYEPDMQTYTLLKDFGGIVPAGDLNYLTRSTDDNWFSFMVGELNQADVLAAWDRDTDTTYQKDMGAGYNAHSITISDDGKYTVFNKSASKKYAWDIVAGTTESAETDATDRSAGHRDMGTNYMFQIENSNDEGGEIYRRPLNDFPSWEPIMQIPPSGHWTGGVHVSATNEDTNLILISRYYATSTAHTFAYDGEIYLTRTDIVDMQNTKRLCHHRTIGNTYWDTPRAAISIDGRFVMYNSNWDDSAQTDVFIVKVPLGGMSIGSGFSIGPGFQFGN